MTEKEKEFPQTKSQLEHNECYVYGYLLGGDIFCDDRCPHFYKFSGKEGKPSNGCSLLRYWRVIV